MSDERTGKYFFITSVDGISQCSEGQVHGIWREKDLGNYMECGFIETYDNEDIFVRKDQTKITIPHIKETESLKYCDVVRMVLKNKSIKA